MKKLFSRGGKIISIHYKRIRSVDSMVKIAYVITDLSYGGAQTMLLQLIKELDRTKFDISVFVREKRLGTGIEDALDEMHINCVYLNISDASFKGSKLIHKIKSQHIVNKALSEFQPDIVHAHLESSYSLLYCLFHRKQCVFTIHSFPDRIFTRQFVAIQKILNHKRRTTLVGVAKCVSTRAKDMLDENFSESITTIYNPIQINKYFRVEIARPKTIFVNVARMNPIKNQMLLLQAFSLAKEECDDIYLRIVGDGELWQLLHDEAIKLGIENFVEFLGNRNDVPDILSTADVFVLTSNSECCPMTVLEAMASGLPVISTDVGGVKELVCDSGILLPANDKTALAKAIIELSKDKSKQYEMGRKARTIVQRFESKIIAQEYSSLYDSIMKKESKNA